MLETRNYNFYISNPANNIWPVFKPSKWTRYADRWESEINNTVSIYKILGVRGTDEGLCFQCSFNGSPVNVLRLIYGSDVYLVVEEENGESHQYYSLLDEEKLLELPLN